MYRHVKRDQGVSSDKAKGGGMKDTMEISKSRKGMANGAWVRRSRVQAKLELGNSYHRDVSDCKG